MKRILTKIAAGVVVLAALAAPAVAQNVAFVISAGLPGTPSDIAATEMIDELAKRSDGRIKGRKVPEGAIGSERDVTEAIQLGSIDMAIASHMGMDSALGKLGFAWFPYMFQSYEDAHADYINGWIGEEINKVLEASGIVPLAMTENGFRQMTNRWRSIKSVEDLAGLKIRVPEIPELLFFYQAAGALPVAIAGGDVLPALQQGTIDGVDNSLMNLNAMSVIKPQKFLTKTNHSYSAGSIVAATNFWSGLGAEDQALFLEVSKEAAARHIANARKVEDELYVSILSDIAVEDVTPELDASLRQAALKVWEQFAPKYDQAVMERIRKEYYQGQ